MTGKTWGRLVAGVLTVAATGCGGPPINSLIFVDGRAVEYVGDTIAGFTAEGVAGLVRLDVRTGIATVVGEDHLNGPVHVQFAEDAWYVSDVENGMPGIVVLDDQGEFRRRIDLREATPATHQFAVLPGGRIVVPGFDGQLIEVGPEGESTFAITDAAQEPALLMAASGGVFHAVPDHHLTLYNAFGNIRWRIEWGWREDTYVSDFAQDNRGRIHALVGVPGQGDGTFRVYTLLAENGEIVRWSVLNAVATFVVDPLGEVEPDEARNWVEGGPVDSLTSTNRPPD